jgi:predicted transport protein
MKGHPMKAVQANFLDLLGSNLTQFVIPVYQRVYSWEERQCQDLWKDIMRAGRTNKPHFIGSFLYTPEGDATATSLKRKLLIDGQQRMTTISLLLASLLDYIDEDESRAAFLAGWWRPIEKTFGQQNDQEFNAFIWYWLWLKVPNRKPRESEAYEEFKAYVQDEGRDRDPKGLLEELGAYSKRYANMFMGKEKDPELKERFDRITELGVKPVRPLLLSLYTIWEETPDRLSKKRFTKLCDYIESFLFRRIVVGRFSTGLNNFFAGMYRELETTENPAEYVTAMLLIHTHGMTAYFPTDEEFTEQLKSRDLYHRFPRTRYYLERLENWGSPKEPIASKNYQIEHVMPQNIDNSPEWQEMLGDNWQDVHERLCNSLGNLTLTGYNPEYSNRPFKDKLNLDPGGFKKSHIHLNEYIAEQSVWNEQAIERRADELAKLATKVWPYPSLPADVVDKYRPKKQEKPASGWTMEDNHPEFMPGGACYETFQQVCSLIEQKNPDWEQYIAKYYVGYRTGAHKLHAAIQPRVNDGSLAIGLPKTVDELDDPKGLAQDKRDSGHFGPGSPTRVDVKSLMDVDGVVELIDQCY